MNTNSFQKILNAIFLLLTMFLLCWNIILSQHQTLLIKSVDDVQSQNNQNKISIKELQTIDNIKTFQIKGIDDRLKYMEDDWLEFLDTMFGNQEQTIQPKQ